MLVHSPGLRTSDPLGQLLGPGGCPAAPALPVIPAPPPMAGVPPLPPDPGFPEPPAGLLPLASPPLPEPPPRAMVSAPAVPPGFWSVASSGAGDDDPQASRRAPQAAA